uniref:Uncharacterized protein n=1 Tax=Pyricularia oryzae (strain P131) TaxID=1143193 RepID=L7JLF0_PYRO1
MYLKNWEEQVVQPTQYIDPK